MIVLEVKRVALQGQEASKPPTVPGAGLPGLRQQKP